MFLNDNGACAENDMLGSGPKEELETKEGFYFLMEKHGQMRQIHHIDLTNTGLMKVE